MAMKYIWLSVSVLIVAGVATNPTAADDALAASTRGIVDVVLTSESSTDGWLLEGDGHAIQGAVATLTQQGSVVAKTVTDDQGRFQFQGVRSGVYKLHVGDQTRVLRVWKATAAPPAARPHVTIVRSERVIRGQSTPRSRYVQGAGGLLAIGIGLGAITVIGIEATDNESSSGFSTTLPPGGVGPLASP